MMYLLFILLLIMLLFSAVVSYYVLKIQHETISRNHYFIFILISVFSLILYYAVTDQMKLNLWLTAGQKHYQLLETFARLGGIEGAIASIEQHLEKNPEDKQGWLLLAKLYSAKHARDRSK